MTTVARYLQELSAAVRTRGRTRRRLLEECREHLTDAAVTIGEAEAVRRFGDAAELAASFDTEIASRRAVRATAATVVGVLSVGASAVSVLNATDPRASAVTTWAVVFFGSAQVAGACAVLSTLRALAMRRWPAAPADLTLLCRRNSVAIAFSALALFAAAAALPGHASAGTVLGGPLVAGVAALAVLRARASVRKLNARQRPDVRAPLPDLRAILRRAPGVYSSSEPAGTVALLWPLLILSMFAAFAWDRLDHGSDHSSLAAAATEATMMLVGFVMLGPALGLWSPRAKTSRTRSP